MPNPARYLGISEARMTHLEAGRRRPSPLTDKRLHWLADLLPPPEGRGRAAPTPATAAAQALAVLRLRALEAETTALGQLLAAQ